MLSSTIAIGTTIFHHILLHILLDKLLSHNGSLKRWLMLYNCELVQKKRAALVRIWVYVSMIMLHTQVVTVSVTVRVVPNSKQKKSITKPFKLTTLPPSCTRQHILTSPIKTGEIYGILSVESSRGVGTVSPCCC